MKPWAAAALLVSGLAWGQARECYKPPMPPLCIPKDVQSEGDHIRCLVVDRIKLLDYIRAMALYQECTSCRK